MKGHLNISCILIDFWSALTRGLSTFQSLVSILCFLATPVALGAVTNELHIKIPNSQFSSLISVYAIFSALLFGAQISAFSIFRSLTDSQNHIIKKPEADPVLKASQQVEAEDRLADLKLAFKDINSNISYLIIISVALLSILVTFAIIGSSSVWASSIVIALTSHLILVLVMVIRQCHLIFTAAYSE